jgi:hypothetical protein
VGDYGPALWAAQRTIAMHTPIAVTQGRPDPHARWRDLLQPERGTTYRVGRCTYCGEDGCELLDAARQLTAVIGPFVDQGCDW